MGQKTHPYGFRLGYNNTWRSRWYAEKKYAELLHEDLRLRKMLKAKLGHAGVSAIEIARATPMLDDSDLFDPLDDDDDDDLLD